MRIAVAASDDEKYAEHFGRAQKFLIYDFDEENLEFMEIRESLKVPGEKHQWGKSLDVLKDCDVVICAQIGINAKPGLKKMGKTVVEDEGTVEEVLERFRKHQIFLSKPLKF
ncbi:NifB/NifX family molybdenum-iron cluster-binding protein [Methanobacterium congolense]|uniref:Dinitrogenase iron-molybdenum cofactor biosynthesis protein n=1 Tax=Methanobacterium congolense TaxID=118062 RepID=A0A1D3L082_9EURY|nr:NifB/NifX family molybdenum-iron cluster-binding protein [Methanobacterium congolense]SCG84958.1 Dinitrogenase iron-molybdenum cofactor biosynthesis protein [Methanobacterium congolense]